MAALRYAVHVNTGAYGPSNEAIVDFELLSPLPGATTDADVVAQILGYLQSALYAADDTAVADVTVRDPGSAGSTHVPFPTAEYAALQTANPSTTVVMGGYGIPFGSGDLAPIGTSFTVSEYTAVPGRSTTGRHYLPFVSAGSVNASGLYPAANIAAVRDAYNGWILGDTSGATVGTVDLQPVVHSIKLGTDQLILQVVPSFTPSNLKTRRR